MAKDWSQGKIPKLGKCNEKSYLITQMTSQIPELQDYIFPSKEQRFPANIHKMQF